MDAQCGKAFEEMTGPKPPVHILLTVPESALVYSEVCRMQVAAQLEFAARERYGTMEYHEMEKVMKKWNRELLEMSRSTRLVTREEAREKALTDIRQRETHELASHVCESREEKAARHVDAALDALTGKGK